MYNENDFFSYDTLEAKVITFHDSANVTSFGLNVCNFQKAMTEGNYLWITMNSGTASLKFGDENAAKLAHNLLQTVIDQLILNCTTISFSDHGRVLYVATTGNDSTAAIGDILHPFTIIGAVAAAVSGDNIIVLPGTYNANSNLLKDGVNIHFSEGSSLSSSATTFTDSGDPISAKITGALQLYNSSFGGVATLTNASSNVSFEFNTIESYCLSTFGVTAGYLRLKGNKITELFQYSFDIEGTGIMDVDIDLVINNGSANGSTINFDGHCVDNIERVCNFNIGELQANTLNFPVVRHINCTSFSTLKFKGNITGPTTGSGFNNIFLGVFNSGTIYAEGRFVCGNSIVSGLATSNYNVIFQNSYIESLQVQALIIDDGVKLKAFNSYIISSLTPTTIFQVGDLELHNCRIHTRLLGEPTRGIQKNSGILIINNCIFYNNSLDGASYSISTPNVSEDVKIFSNSVGTYPNNPAIISVIVGATFLSDPVVLPISNLE